MSQKTQKDEIHVANEGSSPAFFITILGNILRGNVDKEFEVLFGGKSYPKQVFAYDNVRIHSPMR